MQNQKYKNFSTLAFDLYGLKRVNLNFRMLNISILKTHKGLKNNTELNETLI